MKLVYVISGTDKAPLYLKALTHSIISARAVDIDDITVVSTEPLVVEGVECIHHPSQIYSQLNAEFDFSGIIDFILNKSIENQYVAYFLKIPSIYLKMELHDIFPNQEILFCDVDTIFTPKFQWRDLRNLLPFGASFTGQFGTKGRGINAGVFVLDTRLMYKKRFALIDYLRAEFQYVTNVMSHRDWFNDSRLLGLLEEATLTDVFSNDLAHLPDSYNWRPAQGYNDEAAIIHYQSVLATWQNRRHELVTNWGQETFDQYKPMLEYILGE